MQLPVNLAGIKLSHPVMNGAGTCKLIGQVEKLIASRSAAIMVGSITLEPRQFEEGNWYIEDYYSLNSLGLPNPGANYYRENLPEMVRLAHSKDKPLFLSVAGFSLQEFVELTELALNGGVDLVELNLSCPNVWKEGEQKQISCFEPKLVAEILNQVEKSVGSDAKIAAKLSPFSDPLKLKEVAQVISQSKIIKAVTSTNTFPNAFAMDSEGKQRIVRDKGFAGLGGPALKPIGLGQVKQLRDLLPERIVIIGVGGIFTAKDVLDYLQAGALAVQSASAYFNQGVEIFTAIQKEMAVSRELAQ